MTDNEIIKALGCCANNPNDSVCYESKCPLFGQKCIDVLSKNALDLINRQKAEIEILSEAIHDMSITDEMQRRAESHFQWMQFEKLKRVRAEAIKEFADKVFALFPDDKNITYICRRTIKAFLKEMVGDV